MIYLAFLGGVIFGSILSNILRWEFTSFGVMKIDHRNKTCQVCLNTEEIIQKKKKKIVITIDHNANLSQE